MVRAGPDGERNGHHSERQAHPSGKPKDELPRRQDRLMIPLPAERCVSDIRPAFGATGFCRHPHPVAAEFPPTHDQHRKAPFAMGFMKQLRGSKPNRGGLSIGTGDRSIELSEMDNVVEADRTRVAADTLIDGFELPLQ